MSYELAKLAAEAAVEIDCRILGREHDLGVVDDLGKKVDEISRSNLLFPEEIAMYKMCLDNSEKTLRYVDEVKLEIKLLSMELGNARQKDAKGLVELRGYCNEVSRKALGYTELIMRRLA